MAERSYYPPAESLPSRLERSSEFARRTHGRKREKKRVVRDLCMVKSLGRSKQISISSAQWEVSEKAVHSIDSHHREDPHPNHCILLLALLSISGLVAKSHVWLAGS